MNIEPCRIRRGRVLVLGCYHGIDAFEFARQGNHVTAVDEKLHVERKRHSNITYIKSGIRSFEIELGAYDLIFAHDVLPFLGDKDYVKEVISSCEKGLTRNGYFDFNLFGADDSRVDEEGIVFYHKEFLPKIGLEEVYSADIHYHVPNVNRTREVWHVFHLIYQKIS